MAKKYFIEQDKKVGSEKYSQRISKLRIEKQITLDELQEKTGIPKTTISSWIKGDFTPNIKGITAIAKALNVSVDYLVGNTDVKPLNPTLQAISKSTGLSEQAIKNLHKNKDSDEMRYINYLLEYGFLRGFFNEFSLYVNSDKITVPKNNNELSEILFDSDDKKLGEYIENEDNFTNHINFRCRYPLQLHSSFDTAIFEKAVILEMQDRLRMIKEDIQKDGEKE